MRRILLDTHVWLWLQAEPERLSPRTLGVLSDRQNEVFLSAASAWEIAIKHGLGKLELPHPPEDYLPERLTRNGFEPLAVEHRHALRVASLPAHHRDPFDRILVAQAQIEELELMTVDQRLELYEVATADPTQVA